jgi:hypothetical protein
MGGIITRMERRVLVRDGLRIVAVASALWAIFLLGGHVAAPTGEPGRGDCGGSALSVNSEGSSIGGGEPRVDQDAFDRACADHARDRIRLSVVPGSLFVLSLAGVVLERRKRARVSRDANDGKFVKPFTGGVS